MPEFTPSSYRFSTLSSQDRGGLIYITTFLAFTYSSLAFITRCFIKRRMFGLDDWAMVFAQVANIIQFALLLVSLSAGLGKSFDIISPGAYARMALTLYSNQILLYVSLGLSKIATILLIQRLSARDAKIFWILCNTVTTIVVAWIVLAATLLSVGCTPASTTALIKTQSCPGISARYQVLVATDALTDILLVLLPAYLVWQIQMSLLLKTQVIAVFAFRLPLLPFAFLAFMRFKDALQSSNPGADRSSAVIYQQIELCYSLIAATVPCLKSFIRSFDTGSGVKAKFPSYASGSHKQSKVESYRMHALAGDSSQTQRQGEDQGDVRVSKRPL